MRVLLSGTFPALLLNDSGVTLVEYARGTPVDTESSRMDSVSCDHVPPGGTVGASVRCDPGASQRLHQHSVLSHVVHFCQCERCDVGPLSYLRLHFSNDE